MQNQICPFTENKLHSMILKVYHMVEIPVIKVLHQAILPKTRPKLMSIDRTGLESWQRSRHYEKRLNDFSIHEPYTPYVKLDTLIDTETMIIYDHVLRIKPRHDVVGAESIFRRGNFEGIKILGDKGYDSEKLHEIVRSKGGTFFAPVRKSIRTRPKGFYRRK